MSVEKRRPQFSLTGLALLLFGLSAAVKLSSTAWLRRWHSIPAHYSYKGEDYPQEWLIERPFVQQAAQHSTRYQLETPDAIAEWQALVPGDGLIYFGEHKQPYTISMMHQLRCLDILRAELVRERNEEISEPSALSRHCLNYVQQMVLCRGDTQLEPYQHPNHIDPIVTDQVYECKDWSVVYDAMKENQAEYARWRVETSVV